MFIFHRLQGIKPSSLTLANLNESGPRNNLIDPLEKKAGWDLADRRSVGFEIPIESYDDLSLKVITINCIFDNYFNFFVVRDIKSSFIQLKKYLRNGRNLEKV